MTSLFSLPLRRLPVSDSFERVEIREARMLLVGLGFQSFGGPHRLRPRSDVRNLLLGPTSPSPPSRRIRATFPSRLSIALRSEVRSMSPCVSSDKGSGTESAPRSRPHLPI